MSDTELLHKSKPEPVHRLEVFTGTGRRRVWTAEQKAQIVAESYADGEIVTAVARRHGLTPQQLFGWRRQTHRQALREVEKCGPAFTPVVIEERRPAKEAPIAPAAPGGSQVIEIVIGAATVRAAVGVDPTWLRDVLRAVRAARRIINRGERLKLDELRRFAREHIADIMPIPAHGDGGGSYRATKIECEDLSKIMQTSEWQKGPMLLGNGSAATANTS